MLNFKSVTSLVTCIVIESISASPAIAQNEEKTGTITQSIVSAPLVDLDTQRELGLVTVGGRCSGTLLNRFWVITADHCVTLDTNVGSMNSRSLSDLSITSAWSTRIVIPSRLVRNWGPGQGIDIAMLFLGSGDFGYNEPLRNITIGQGPIQPGERVMLYGRGIYSFGAGTGPNNSVPAQRDGLYRGADFTVSGVGGGLITVETEEAGQSIAGGDSGGGMFQMDFNGFPTNLIGVHSVCYGVTYVPGQPQTWTWITNLGSCASQDLTLLRAGVINVAQEGWDRDTGPCPRNVAAACGVVEITNTLLLQ